MKIRQGYVSNSSSSSFVMIGVEDPADFVKEHSIDSSFQEWWYENEDNISLRLFDGDSVFYLGKQLMDEVEYSEIERMNCEPGNIKEIEEELEKLGIKGAVGIYAGSESC